MTTYIIKRLLLMIPTLIGITFLTYMIVRLAPGDPIEAMIMAQSGNIDEAARKAEADRIRERLGIKDKDYNGDGEITAGEKFLGVFEGYGKWFWRCFRHGDFGESIKYRDSQGRRNPIYLFKERILITLSLNITAEILIFAIAIPIGLASARHRGGVFDRSTSILLLALYSIPAILAGTLLLGFLCRGGQGWEIFPVAGLHSEGAENMNLLDYTKDLFWHVAMPVTCMVYGGLAYLAKLGRASLLETLQMDYIRTARAKGLPERRVVYVHGLRNSLLPMITIMVMTLPALIGGSVIVETIFSIQGMGLLMVNAARAYDLSVIMTGTMIFGALTLIAILIGDILYAWADPRVRYA